MRAAALESYLNRFRGQYDKIDQFIAPSRFLRDVMVGAGLPATRIDDHLHDLNVLPVRYERWFSEPEVLRAEIGAFLGVELGPGAVRLHRPDSMPDEAIQAVVNAHCETARVLGYALD